MSDPTPPGSPAAGTDEVDFARERELWKKGNDIVEVHPGYVRTLIDAALVLLAARQAAEVERNELAEWKAEQQQHIIRSCVRLLNAGMPESAGPGIEDGIAWLIANLAAAEGREAELREALKTLEGHWPFHSGRLEGREFIHDPDCLRCRLAALLARPRGGSPEGRTE